MATNISVRLDKSKLDAITQGLPEKVDDLVGKMALEVQADAVSSFGTGPDGRIYRHGGVDHVASAPPGPPAVDTGTLRASIHTDKISNGVWRVSDGVEYGAYLEFGTPFMSPRPWLTPAIFKMKQVFNMRFKDLFE